MGDEVQELGYDEFVEEDNEEDEEVDDGDDFGLQTMIINCLPFFFFFFDQFYFVFDHQGLFFDDEVEDGSDGAHEEGSEDPSQDLSYPSAFPWHVNVFPDDFIGFGCFSKQDFAYFIGPQDQFKFLSFMTIINVVLELLNDFILYLLGLQNHYSFLALQFIAFSLGN